jgi:hypothetical protein
MSNSGRSNCCLQPGWWFSAVWPRAIPPINNDLEMARILLGYRVMALPKFGLFIALLSPLLLSPAYAQRGGGHGGGGGGGHAVGGFSGRAVGGFRGGYYGGGFYGGRYWGGGLYFGLGGWGYPYYYGYPYYGGYPYYAYSPYYNSYDPYAYGGGYSAPNYGYPPQQSSYPPQQPSYPPQQSSYPPQSQSRPAPTQSSASNSQGYYLIAFNDHTLQAATAYKVEDGQIHWITREGQERQAPLSSVDIEFSQQMNRDRHVEFPIP